MRDADDLFGQIEDCQAVGLLHPCDEGARRALGLSLDCGLDGVHDLEAIQILAANPQRPAVRVLRRA